MILPDGFIGKVGGLLILSDDVFVKKLFDRENWWELDTIEEPLVLWDWWWWCCWNKWWLLVRSVSFEVDLRLPSRVLSLLKLLAVAAAAPWWWWWWEWWWTVVWCSRADVPGDPTELFKNGNEESWFGVWFNILNDFPLRVIPVTSDVDCCLSLTRGNDPLRTVWTDNF